jgi:hypothetical protein
MRDELGPQANDHFGLQQRYFGFEPRVASLPLPVFLVTGLFSDQKDPRR